MRIKTHYGLIQELEKGKWKVSWRDSTGIYRRFRFEAENAAEALKEAERIVGDPEVLPQKPVQKKPPIPEPIYSGDLVSHQIADILQKSCRETWTDYHRDRDFRYISYFLRFVDKEGLTYWRELRFEHVEKYRVQLVKRGLKTTSIRHYLNPVRRASRFAAINYPDQYRDFCLGLRIKDDSANRRKYHETEGNPAMSIHEVLDFMDSLLRGGRRSLALGVALQGLCGMQLQEVFRLTWEKVDLENAAITIEGEVKNRFRVRRIPIPRLAVWLLRQSKQAEGRIITGYQDWSYYAQAVRNNLRRFKPGIRLAPKDLRNTIQTEAIDGGWYGYYVKRYVGHAPEGIGEKHYMGDQGWKLFANFQKKVLIPVEETISTWKQQEGKSPAWGELLQDCTVIAR